MGFKNRRLYFKMMKLQEEKPIKLPVKVVMKEGKFDSIMGKIACFVTRKHTPVILGKNSDYQTCLSCWKYYN